MYHVPEAKPKTRPWRQLLPWAALRVLCGFAGASLGYLVGTRGDLLLSVDTEIVGLVLGAALGSLVPLRRGLGLPERAAAAVAGVLMALEVWLERSQLASEAYWAFGLRTAFCSVWVAQLVYLIAYVVRRGARRSS